MLLARFLLVDDATPLRIDVQQNAKELFPFVTMKLAFIRIGLHRYERDSGNPHPARWWPVTVKLMQRVPKEQVVTMDQRCLSEFGQSFFAAIFPAVREADKQAEFIAFERVFPFEAVD